MNISDKNFLDEVEEYTSGKLKRRDDIQKLIEVVISNGKAEEFESLTFTAKYISGLLRVLKSAPGIPKVNSIDHVKNDLSENMKKGIELMKEIILSGDENFRKYFDDTYLSLSPQNFSNLSQLFSDLDSVKKYLNYLKRQT